MHLQARQCAVCSAAAPRTCDPPCGSGEACTIIGQSCAACATTTCTAISAPSSTKQGVNAGAVAGGLFAGIIVLLAVAGYFWYRRRTLNAAAAVKRATVEVKPDIVASADTVLNRPDPVEKPSVIIVSHDDGTTDGHPDNPFSDHASIATASDRATNVIPIGLLPTSSASIAHTQASTVPTARTPASVATTALSAIPEDGPVPQRQPGTPMRPTRDGPELDMRLDLSRPASEAPSFLVPPKIPYAGSSRSGASGVSSRASTLSTSSSFLNEAPQIVTSKQANFRQVLGVQRAEVVQLVSNPPSPSSNQRHLSTSTTARKSTAPSQSPLRKTAFDAQAAQGALDSHNVQNPFADDHLRPTSARSSASASTFGFSDEHFNSQSPTNWDESSRPGSTISTAGTIIASISSAQRAQVVKPETRGLYSNSNSKASSPLAPSFSSRSAGQLSPPAQGIPRSFDDDMNPRMSQSSLALSNRTSTTDSILEAFPFVPPSPMSAAHQSHPNTPLRREFNGNIQENIPQNDQTKAGQAGRMTLGMSVMSTASGLGGFPFQIDSSIPLPTQATSNYPERDDRASLDTLQLSRELAAFPLPSPSTPTTPKTSDPLHPVKH